MELLLRQHVTKVTGITLASACYRICLVLLSSASIASYSVIIITMPTVSVINTLRTNYNKVVSCGSVVCQ